VFLSLLLRLCYVLRLLVPSSLYHKAVCSPSLASFPLGVPCGAYACVTGELNGEARFPPSPLVLEEEEEEVVVVFNRENRGEPPGVFDCRAIMQHLYLVYACSFFPICDTYCVRCKPRPCM